jgi:hypothetical protein
MFLNSTFPICYLPNNKILVFQKGKFLIYDYLVNNFDFVVDYSTSLFNLFSFSFSLFARILRKGVRCGCLVDNDLVVVCLDKNVLEINLKNKSISRGFKTPDGSRPLVFTNISGIKGFDDGIYFGGYKSNPRKEPISIYRRISQDEWVVVFTFPEGEIEHIHNIVPDPHRNILYVLTGDFQNSSAIWVVENNFKSVKAVVRGEQIFRACVGFSTLDGLIYATDSPFSENSIRILKEIDGLWHSTFVQKINGPSIYGCVWKDKFVFSTSVEGDGRNIDLFYKLFGRSRGKGVVDNNSVIYAGDYKNGFTPIYKIRKDFLPFYFFQFGVLIFPAGKNDSDVLPIYHIATRKYSMGTKLLSLNIDSFN